MCKNPEAGKVLDTFEKRIKSKCDEYGSEWEIWIAGRFYCFCLPSIYSNNDGNGLIEGAVEDGGTI